MGRRGHRNWRSGALLAVALAGCHRPAAAPATSELSAQGDAAGRMAIAIPGVDAVLPLPALNPARHLQFDGIRTAPGTRIEQLDIANPGRRVRLRFRAPQPPAALLAYYAQAGARAGWTVRPATDALVAMRGPRRLRLTVTPAATGSEGLLLIDNAG